MKHQTTFAQAEFTAKKKPTSCERFLARMEEVIPWARLLAVIAPHYPKGERGRPPIGLERMLRVYFLQQWYALADEALEDALYDSQAMQRFARIEFDAEGVPDATTLLKFRLLETHDLGKALFTEINADLARAACCCAKARWWTARSSPRRPRPRTRTAHAIPSCTRPRRATSGFSG